MTRLTVIRMLVAATLLLAPAAAAAAVGATAWDETGSSRVRLIAGGALAPGAAERLAGIDIRLAPGWKTYWRVPGDSGVPPVFDWSASDNVGDVRVEFPAPARYVDAYATTIGYEGEVIFPVVITPRDPARPVIARLAFSYAVCKDICIPVRSQFTLDLGDASGAPERALIDRYRARVPTAVAGDEAGILSVRAEGEGANTRLVVDLVPAAPDVIPDVFVEGPDLFYFGTPEVAPFGGRLRLAIPVDGVTAGNPLRGETLRLTVVGGKRAVERTVSVP